MQTIKRGDTGQRFMMALTLDDEMYDLNGKTPRFVIRNILTHAVIKVEASIDSAESGLVSYSPTDSDVDVPGEYQVECEVEDSGKFLTFPRDGYELLRILEDLG